jgi:hypothetical protein
MKKLFAGFMTALVALLTATAPVLAVQELGAYPTFLKGDDGTLNTYVVVGSAANVADVVGAVDIAARLAEVGKSTVSQACSGASGSLSGQEKDTIPLGGLLSGTFPSSGVLKSAHYSTLKDSTYSWRGTDYDYREQVDIGGVQMRFGAAVPNVNGTLKMEVENGDVVYQYVFEKALTGTGSVASPNYTYPINIKLLGKDFSIVGITSNNVKMLQGSIGTATATTPVVYGEYSVYSDLGFSGAATATSNWARVIIKDADGNTVDTQTINQGDSKQSTATGLTIMLLTVRALTDGTVVGSDVVVGLTADGVTKTYDVTADVTSTGTTSDRFPGETLWGIEVASGIGATDGAIAVGDTLEVVYKPSSTQYFLAGSVLALPNNYGDLGFEGYNTDRFATVTIKPVVQQPAYNVSADTQVFGDLNGFEISTDVTGSIVSNANTGYSKAYILFNKSRDATTDVAFLGFYDSTKEKVLVSGTILGITDAQTGEYVSRLFNSTNGVITYSLLLNYGNAGELPYHYLNVTIGGGSGDKYLVNYIGAGNTTAGSQVKISFTNATAVSTAAAPTFRLGATASVPEAEDVNVTYASTEGNTAQVGKKVQDIVSDSGIIVASTETYGASDRVVLKIPFKDLKAKVYFGKLGSGVSGDSVTYTSYPSIPIVSAIAKLDSEISATEKAKNLITVGGPCVNSVTADALGLTYPSCGVSSTIPENKGLVKVVDSPYTDGKVVVVVAGWEAENTRASSSVLQLFDTKLAGVTASAVEVTGTIGSPVVTPV